MESSSASSWEAAFSLSNSNRERAARSCRLRHRQPSVEWKSMDRDIPSSERGATALYQTQSVNSVKDSSTIVAKEEHESNDLDGTPQICKSKRARTSRKLAALSLNGLKSEHEANASIPAREVDTAMPRRVSHITSLRSKNICVSNGSQNEEASAAQICDSLSTRTYSKRAKTQMEITDSEFDYDKLPARLEQEFFRCDALELAPKLLGKFLRRDEVVLQITEAEAYRPNDSACHGRFGITPRTAAMFGPAGHAYVYLCYGMHVMLNIVADIEGVGAAVLIRSCAPVAGLKTIQARRGILSTKPVLLSGPGKIGQALGLTTEWSSHPLYLAGGLELLDGPAVQNIFVGPRVGIDSANPEDVSVLWRFVIGDSAWISAPRNNLIPLAF